MNARDKQWLSELAVEHATPFWVVFPRAAQARYFELIDVFQKVAKNVRIFYSVKTNPHTTFLQSLYKMESGFECVSLRELQLVNAYDTPKIFNSCASSDDEILLALKQNAIIVIDSLSQAEQVARLATSKPIAVGLRVRMDQHRFGFAPQEVKPMIEALSQMGLNVTLLHTHPGTNCSVNIYRNFVSRVAGLVQDLPSITALDLGGGFPGKTSLMERKEGLEAYAEIVKEQLGDFLKTRSLYLESGRFLVEDSMILVTKVMHVKKMDGTHFALLDAGINVLPRISMSPFRFFALTETGETKANFRLGGPLMFGSDEFGQIHGKLKIGDLIGVENVGAYCTELAWKLSRDLPEMIVIE